MMPNLLQRVLRQKCVPMLLIGLLSFLGSWELALHRGMPRPLVQDEFSYLLAADTFAHGRITNPTPLFWEHFETFQELIKPSYMSKYPPGQGLFLALGKILFKSPIFGVWISDACMCAAIVWMLYAWVPPRWAFVGGLIAAIQFGIFTYWSQSFWGGAAAALGGALMLGALPRMVRGQKAQDVLVFSLGIGLLLITRPLEGILLGLPIGLWAGARRFRKNDIYDCLKKSDLLVTFVLSLLAMTVLMGFYNQRITGRAYDFPHQTYARMYSSVPMLIWQPLKPMPRLDLEEMRQYEETWIKNYFVHKRTWEGFWEDLGRDLDYMFHFYFGYPLGLAALLCFCLRPLDFKRLARTAGVFALVGMVMACAYCRARAHYYAPLTCLVILLLVQGLRVLAAVQFWQWRLGRGTVYALMLTQLILDLQPLPPQIFHDPLATVIQPAHSAAPKIFTREQLARFLRKQGGRHLVMVHYPAWHLCHWEWVFNEADIGHAAIVWARDLGEEKNQALRAYFKDRAVWRIDITQEFPHFGRFDGR